MLKYMLGGVVLLLTGLVCAQDESIPPPETANLQLTDAAIYDFCEQLSADKYPQNLMDMDLNFNRIHYYAVSMLTDDPHAEAKIACLKQKRLEMRRYALQTLKQNSANNQYLQADYFKYLVRIKSLYVKKLLLNSFEQKTTSATEQESIIDYLLYYQTFYIKDNDGYANLREKPSATSNSIKKLTNGTQITLINYHNNWWYVMLDNNQTGYIYVDRITDK